MRQYTGSPNAQYQKDLMTRLQQAAKKVGIDPNKIRISMLRVLAPLKGDDSQIVFRLEEKHSVMPRYESLLSERRAFLGVSFGLGIHRCPQTSENQDTVFSPGNGLTVAYPHPNIFKTTIDTAAGHKVSELDAIRMMYNGFFKLETDQDTRIDQMLTSVFMENTDITDNQVNLGIPLKDLGLTVPFVGSLTNKISITLPNGKYDAIGGSTGANGVVYKNYGEFNIGGLEILDTTKENLQALIAAMAR